MRVVLFILVLALASVEMSSNGWAEYNCSSTPGGKCGCVGASDCSGMRKSGMCDGLLTCNTDKDGAPLCSCIAKRKAPPEGTGGLTPVQPGGAKQPDGSNRPSGGSYR
jgi:hypothetical protein